MDGLTGSVDRTDGTTHVPAAEPRRERRLDRRPDAAHRRLGHPQGVRHGRDDEAPADHVASVEPALPYSFGQTEPALARRSYPAGVAPDWWRASAKSVGGRNDL